MKRKFATSIDSELIERVDALAAKLHSNRSAMLERMVRDSLEAEEAIADFITSPGGKAAMAGFVQDPKMAEALRNTFGADVDLTDRRMLVAILKQAAAGKLSVRKTGEEK